MKKTLLFLLTLSGLSVLSAKIIREYHYIKKSKTWAGAQSYCREKFTDLATVRNKADQDKLLSVLQGGGKYAWIGLHDDLTRWTWVLRNAGFSNDTDFSNWKTSEPVVQPSMRTCSVMTENGDWRSAFCWRRRPAVCYDEQGPPRYILMENRTSWYKARTYCRSMYTGLVGVRNMAENERISSLLSENTWIGLYRKHWAHWSDRSPRTFTCWNSGQPNNTWATVDSCAVVNTITGRWRDAKCDAKHYFVCQRPKLRHKTTLKLKFQSEADLNDPAVQQQVSEQLHAKLEKHGLSDFKLRWIHTNGQTFHKKQKRKKEDGMPIYFQ